MRPSEGVPDALVTLSREVDACALVVGRDLSGDVTRLMLQHSLCPVAVSPLSSPVPGEEEPLRVIGVAYDKSAGARFALSSAMQIASATGARVELISIGPDAAEPEADTGAAHDAANEPVAIDVRVFNGDPAARLIEATDGLDLLLCGSHGRGRSLSAILGSVSGRLVREAHCPVLVVPLRIRNRATAPLGLTTAAG